MSSSLAGRGPRHRSAVADRSLSLQRSSQPFRQSFCDRADFPTNRLRGPFGRVYSTNVYATEAREFTSSLALRLAAEWFRSRASLELPAPNVVGDHASEAFLSVRYVPPPLSETRLGACVSGSRFSSCPGQDLSPRRYARLQSGPVNQAGWGRYAGGARPAPAGCRGGRGPDRDARGGRVHQHRGELGDLACGEPGARGAIFRRVRKGTTVAEPLTASAVRSIETTPTVSVVAAPIALTQRGRWTSRFRI